MSASAPLTAAQADLQRRLPPIIAGLSVLGPFAIDTYLPAFGSIGRELGATPLQVQQTLTAYLVPFALMALWHGAVSDALGRKRVVIVGLALFALASLGAAASQSIEALCVWRALQGAVAGVGMTVGRAVVRDVADGPQAQRMLSQATMFFALAPAVAPIIGGWIDAFVGWRGVFGFLALVAVAMMVFCLRMLPETLPVERRVSLRPGPMARAYRQLATDPAFLRLAAILSLNFSGFFVYVLAAPAFLGGALGLEPTAFAWLFVPAVAGTMTGAYLSSRLAGRLSPVRSITVGYGLTLLSVALNLAQALLMDPPRVPWATAPLFVYNVGISLAMAPLQVMLLDLFAERRGMAASGMAFTTSVGNAVVAGAIAPLLWHSAAAMAAGAGACVVVAAALFAWHVRSPSFRTEPPTR
ncbi:MAG: multidrug effflux MFS transporter [Burkholderiales bacterium]|jgi:DHA1 family bicyclomycin/chloramphenicol resistance-like MFS transporter